jgi:hypothetical protein
MMERKGKRKGRIMKDELKSVVAGGYGGTRVNRRQKWEGQENQGKSIFLPKSFFCHPFARPRTGKRSQIASIRCFWSKCPSNGENLNPGLSQCVAVSRSDKFVKGAGSPQPFSLSTFSWRQQRRRIRVHSRLELPPLVAWSRWVKLGQTDQGFDGVSPCHKSIWKYFKMNSLQNNG